MMGSGIFLMIKLFRILHLTCAEEMSTLEVSNVEFPTSNEAAARLDDFTISESTTGLTACIRIKLEYYNNGYTTLFALQDGDWETGYSFAFYLAIGWKTGLEMDGLQDGLSGVYLNTSWTYGVHDKEVRWHSCSSGRKLRSMSGTTFATASARRKTPRSSSTMV